MSLDKAKKLYYQSIKNWSTILHEYWEQIAIGGVMFLVEPVCTFWSLTDMLDTGKAALQYAHYQLPLQFALIGLCICLHRVGGVILTAVIKTLYVFNILSTIFLVVFLRSFWSSIHFDLIAQTNIGEAFDLVRCRPITWLILCTILLGTIVFFSIRALKNIKKYKALWSPFLGMILMLPFLTWCIYSKVKHNTLQIPFLYPSICGACYDYITHLDCDMELVKLHKCPKSVTIEDGEIVGIFILGESANRHHMGCYGYSRDTTPYMSARNGWILYDHVLSAAVMTGESITWMFSNKKIGDEAPQNFILLSYLLNNENLPVYSSFVSSQHFGKKSDIIENTYLYSKNKIHVRHRLGYQGDEDLIQYVYDFIATENDVSPKKLLIVQMMGSHIPFFQRYPDKYNVFNNSKDGEKEIDYYDNSILYSDFCIEEMIKIVEKNNSRPIWVMYVSDHGENPICPRQESSLECWSIPFMFYFNDKFKKKYPQLVEDVSNAKKSAFQSDACFDIICYLMGISWEGFEYERIPWHETFIGKEYVFPKSSLHGKQSPVLKK